MVAEVWSGTVRGIQGELIMVQADISDGLPLFGMTGHLSSEVKEAKDRVRTALKNTGYHLPPKRVSVNLAPADMRKSGACYDFAIAVGILTAMSVIPGEAVRGILFLGELALDGMLSPVTGVLAILQAAYRAGCRTCAVPRGNAKEASLLPGMRVLAFSNLREAVDHLSGRQEEDGEGTQRAEGSVPQTGESEKKPAKNAAAQGTEDVRPQTGESEKKSAKNAAAWEAEESVRSVTKDREQEEKEQAGPDLSEVKGQQMAKRALEIAVAGGHNLFLDGPPGAGKSMLAACTPGIMPEMSREEQIDATVIYSVKGLLRDDFSLVRKRPCRAPSSSVTIAGMFGGGGNPRPGEVTLAHHGVLFLDEFPEFKKELIEMFRVVLEEHKITQIRNGRTVTFPADFIFIAAANPCPCGYYPDRRYCRCTPRQVLNYQSRLSGPILDRLDLFVRCDKVSYAMMAEEKKAESSAVVRERIRRVWELQKERFARKEYLFNGRMPAKDVERYCVLDGDSRALLKEIFDRLQLTGRSYHRILKVSRTIADLEESEEIREEHVREALLFRRTSPFFE